MRKHLLLFSLQDTWNYRSQDSNKSKSTSLLSAILGKLGLTVFWMQRQIALNIASDMIRCDILSETMEVRQN